MTLSAWKSGSRWTLALAAYPLVIVGALISADQSVLRPLGTTWLWVPGVFVPLLAARALLSGGRPADTSTANA